jgi:magnesium-transporting ATPase (P-type)
MLQRKQTLWMLLALICAALTFKFAFYFGNMKVGLNGIAPLEVKAVPTLGAGSVSASAGSVLILIVTVLIIGGILVNIFNFKSRGKQLLITIGLIVLSLLNIFLYWWKSGTPPFESGSYSVGMLFSLAIPVLLVMAALGIRKDQRLVKSADRLR